MRKFLLTGVIICLGFTTIYSQQIEQKNIKGVAYIKQKGNWVIKSAKSDKIFLVNEEVITLKLKGDRSITKERIIRKNNLGYMDIQVPKDVDVMDYYDKLQEEYRQEIESIDINYYAELGFSPNDTQINNQWYLYRTAVFNTRGWQPGIYTVIVRLEKDILTGRLVVHPTEQQAFPLKYLFQALQLPCKCPAANRVC